jgi:hypothetical protein
MDDRQSNPIDASSPVGATSWLWHPMHMSAVRNSESAVPAAVWPAAGPPVPAMKTTIVLMLRRRRIGVPFRMVGSFGFMTGRYQPWKKPPSNQSQRM